MTAPTPHEAQRLVDLALGLNALLEPEEPSETAITAARWLSMELVTVARCVERIEREADMREQERLRREVRS